MTFRCHPRSSAVELQLPLQSGTSFVRAQISDAAAKACALSLAALVCILMLEAYVV